MTESWIQALGGRFIVFDGPDGSGKSTQIRRLAALAREHGLDVCEVREPGGTAVGEEIRRILLDPQHETMDVRCEMLLYMASRAQLVAERIAPARAQGRLVLADRFISSTLAYQGTGGGVSVEEILAVGRVAVGDCWPDLVVIFDVDEEAAARRLASQPRHHSKYVGLVEPTLFSDRLELKGRSYQKRVRQGYLQQARHDPDRHLVIDARPDADTVFETLCDRLGRWRA